MPQENQSTKKRPRVSLLLRIFIAIALGIGAGLCLPLWSARLFLTFNALFSQFLGLCVPLIIIGFVAPAITDIGSRSGRMLIFTVLLAYIDTITAGCISYWVADWLFPSLVADKGGELSALTAPESTVTPYFTLKIDSPITVITALVLAFIVGLIGAAGKIPTISAVMNDLRTMISVVITRVIIPLLPLYIFGIFFDMTISGGVMTILTTFAKIIGIIFGIHVFVLVFTFTVAAFFSNVGTRNPLKLLYTMLPAYMTALGTSSSAATIPVTLRQTIKMGVDEDVAGFTVPLCATIHMSGSTLKIVACAMALLMMHGLPYDFPLLLGFICLLGVTMVAAPGVPGGAIMAAVALLPMLGFNDADNALMIALYITMDSFGTACNVTGDGALSIIVDRFFGKKHVNAPAR